MFYDFRSCRAHCCSSNAILGSFRRFGQRREIPTSAEQGEFLLGKFYEMAKAHLQSSCQRVGNLNPDANFPKLNRADICPVEIGFFRKRFLGESQLLPFQSNSATEGLP